MDIKWFSGLEHRVSGKDGLKGDQKQARPKQSWNIMLFTECTVAQGEVNQTAIKIPAGTLTFAAILN